jgi:hypothetical protein
VYALRVVRQRRGRLTRNCARRMRTQPLRGQSVTYVSGIICYLLAVTALVVPSFFCLFCLRSSASFRGSGCGSIAPQRSKSPLPLKRERA